MEIHTVRKPDARVLGKRWPWLADEFLKKGAVMNHDLAQVFGAGLALRAAKSALVGCTIIFENARMTDGDLRRALFKVADRVAARGQDVAEELVGVSHRVPRPIDEARLNSAPGFEKPRTV